MAKMSKAQAGRLGGLATVARHGRDYMVQIGRKGAATFYDRYRLEPVGTSQFAIVSKETGQVVAYMDGQNGGRNGW